MFLVGVDPGGTTGIAWREVGTNVIRSLDVVVGGDYGRVGEVVRVIERVMDEEVDGVDCRILCEDFVLVPHSVLTRDGSVPLIVIGALYGAFGSLVSLGQNAALAKSTFTDKRLRTLGLWDRRSPHERDAVRHVLLGERRLGRR